MHPCPPPLSAVSSVSGFHVCCLAMASRMPGWFGGSDGLLQYVVPHCVRKLWLRVERLCDKGAWSTTTAGRSYTPAGLKSDDFAKFFDNLSLKELLELCPDSGEHMQCLPEVSREPDSNAETRLPQRAPADGQRVGVLAPRRDVYAWNNALHGHRADVAWLADRGVGRSPPHPRRRAAAEFVRVVPQNHLRVAAMRG